MKPEVKPLFHTAIRPADSSPRLRYPFVTNWKGFSTLPPMMQVGLKLSEAGIESTMAGLACYGTSVATQAIEGPSILTPSISHEQYNEEVAQGQITPYLEQSSHGFINTLSPYIPDRDNVESIRYLSTVKIDADGKVTTAPYSFDFNDSFSNNDGSKTDYYTRNQLVSINNKNGQTELYIYSTLTSSAGVGSYSYTNESGQEIYSPLNKVYFIREPGSNDLILAIKPSGEGDPNPIIGIKDAFDDQGNFIGGTYYGFQHDGSWAEIQPVLDNLIGTVGTADIVSDNQGNLIDANGIFGVPTAAPPPMFDYINVNYSYDPLYGGSEITVADTPAPPEPTIIPINPTEIQVTPSKIIVTEGSDWAKAGVPVGLEIKNKGNVYYAINAVGQEVELGKLNDANQFEVADALKWKLAATREESNTSISKIPWELASKGAANRVGKLIGQPFGEEVVTDKDVISKGVVKSNELRWTAEAEAFFNQHPEALPAKIIGYFTTEYEGKILWGKVVEWDTKDDGIVYVSMINSDADYNQSHPGEQIFPIGLTAKDAKAVEPKGLISKNDDINALLRIWIDNNSPPIALEDFILVGRTG